MTRKILFSWFFVPTILALLAAPSVAATRTTTIGDAQVTVLVSPDPPQVGSNAITVTVSGSSSTALAQTSVHYETLMPSMGMNGPSGSAARIPGRRGAWRFDLPFGEAAQWTLRLQFSGGISGIVDTNLAVGQAVRSTKVGMKQSVSITPSESMQGVNSGGGDAGAWRNATFALLAVILIGALVLWRDRRPLTIALVVLAGVLVVGIAYVQSHNGSSSMGMGSMSARGSAPVPVTLAQIGSDESGATISAPAYVKPYLTQNIVARAPGLLTDLLAYTGDHLYAGEVVAHLNEPELQSNAQAAQAGAMAAQSQHVSAQENTVSMQADVSSARESLRYWNAELVRERDLLKQGAVSVQEYQNERAQATAAQSAYDSARAKLAAASAAAQGAQAQVQQAAANAQSQSVIANYTNIIVPDESVVIKRLVDPGVYVEPGTPILQVAVINRLRVQVQVAQQDLASVQVGTPIDIMFTTGKDLHAHISSISPVVDPTTHTGIAEAIVANTNDAYQPGGYVHVVLHISKSSHAHSFTVPSGAIVGGAASAIWADVSGVAHRVSVNVLSDDGTNAAVTGDLRAGMRVVVSGAENLEEGQTITEGAP